MFARLKEPSVVPYDLVIFDEAHKLSANRGTDLRVRKTDRYRLAEALAGVGGLDEAWTLPWAAHHLLLLTATPHQGKDYPTTRSGGCSNRRCCPRPRRSTIIQRSVASPISSAGTKEEMVHLDGKPLYPKRISDTLGLRPDPGADQRADALRRDHRLHAVRLQPGQVAQPLGRTAGDERLAAPPGQFHVRACCGRSSAASTSSTDLIRASPGGQTYRGAVRFAPAPAGGRG